MIKFKKIDVRLEVDKLIKDVAEVITFYDPRLPEESQCSGYHVFKQMCLIDICDITEFNTYRVDSEFYNLKAPPGYYLISQIHPNLRAKVIDLAKDVRILIKEGKADKVIILKE